MQITDFNWFLFLGFLVLFLVSFSPVNHFVKTKSENIMLSYNMTIILRLGLVVMFLILGAQIELLCGIALGLLLEIPMILRVYQIAYSHEVLA